MQRRLELIAFSYAILKFRINYARSRFTVEIHAAFVPRFVSAIMVSG